MEEKNVVTFTDENNDSFEFEIADSFEMDGNKYVALIPPEEAVGDDEDAEVLIMRIESENDDEDIFVSIEEDEELDKAFAMFKDRCSDVFDFAD